MGRGDQRLRSAVLYSDLLLGWVGSLYGNKYEEIGGYPRPDFKERERERERGRKGERERERDGYISIYIYISLSLSLSLSLCMYIHICI